MVRRPASRLAAALMLLLLLLLGWSFDWNDDSDESEVSRTNDIG